jgi:hypothetical protein
MLIGNIPGNHSGIKFKKFRNHPVRIGKYPSVIATLWHNSEIY